MSSPLIINPLKVYEVSGEVCPLLCARLAATVANNQQVIAAVSGKRHRIMGWLIQSNGAGTSTFIFRSASGGTALFGPHLILANTAGVIDHLPIVDTGYHETNTGDGLFIDVTTTAATIQVFYITYTPS